MFLFISSCRSLYQAEINEAIYAFHNSKLQTSKALKTIANDLKVKYAIRQTVYVVFIKTRLVFRYSFGCLP